MNIKNSFTEAFSTLFGKAIVISMVGLTGATSAYAGMKLVNQTANPPVEDAVSQTLGVSATTEQDNSPSPEILETDVPTTSPASASPTPSLPVAASPTAWPTPTGAFKTQLGEREDGEESESEHERYTEERRSDEKVEKPEDKKESEVKSEKMSESDDETN